MLVLLFVASLVLAYANGSNDNFKATATLYGSRRLDYHAARRLATVAQLSGSMASVVLAGSLLRVFSGKGLVPDSVVGDPVFLVAVGAGAAATVLLATRIGAPISTTHALVGALTGAGWALAPGALSWLALGGSYFAPLLISPLLAVATAATLYPLACRLRMGLGVEPCLCVGEALESVTACADGSLIFERSGTRLTFDEAANCRSIYSGEWFGIGLHSFVDWAHRGSAFSLGFARGLNDTPKILALLVASGWAGLDPRLSLSLIAGAMAIGGTLRARRVAETLSHRITSLSEGQGFLANAIASGLVIGASLLGSPVSTTHVSTGAIFGIGVWNAQTDWKMVSGIVAAWLVTLPISAAASATLAMLLD